MIDLIRKEAARIQEQMWEIATEQFGLERTQETADRIKFTFFKIMNDHAIERGFDIANAHLKSLPDFDPVDDGMALGFVVSGLAESEMVEPAEALNHLITAAEHLGMLREQATIRNLIDATDRLKSRSISNPAAELAKKRHAETYALAKEAIEHWRENIPADLSAQKAANELVKVVPLSHKKLAEYVSAEKKKVSALRTAEPERKA